MKTISVFLSCAAVLFSVVASAATEAITSPPRQEMSDEASLKVWSRKDNLIIDGATLIAELAQHRFVLLGEVHDNPVHHRLRAQIITKLNIERARINSQASPPAAVFEHASTDRQPQFDALTARNQTTTDPDRAGGTDEVAAFFKAVDWRSRGWPNSELFVPLVKAVLKARMSLYAGDVPRQRMMRVARGSSTPESDALPDADIARLKLDKTLGKANNQAALTEIAEAHCGVLPESMLEPMAYAQRLRDATLADILIKASEKQGSAILFAGNGHVRDDRGVPWYIRTRTGAKVVSVLVEEVRSGTPKDPSVKTEGDTAPPASAPPNDTPAADYVIWTQPHERPDPCRKLREKYGKTKR